jgi:peptide/histidine transporter 3/4
LELVGFCGVQSNLIMYLTGHLGMSTAAAAASANAWAGTEMVLPLAGALIADSRLGRYRAVLVAGVLYLLSLGMLTVSSTLRAPEPRAASSPSFAQLAFFYVALYLLAVARGFHRPCAEALGADQFTPSDGEDPSSRASRSSYFNWFHFSLSCGYGLATTGLTYVEDNVSWTVGFGACWAMMVLYLAVFLLGTPTYRAERHVGDVRFVEAVRAWAARVFRRKDAAGTERLLAGEPEDGKGKGFVAKLLPIWATSLIFAAILAQVSTLFTKQGSTLDRRLGMGTGIVVPPAALQFFLSFSMVTTLPIYDRLFVPFARRVTGHHAGLTTLQRIGAGMATAGVAMVGAALVEARRLRVAREAGLVDKPDAALPMSLWWMLPQYVLLGVAIVLGEIGLQEFFYDQVPDALRSVGLALCMSIFGVGNYVSGMLVSATEWATRSTGESWFSDDLNRAHLDYFYWLLAGLAALEVALFLHLANRYVYRSKDEL